LRQKRSLFKKSALEVYYTLAIWWFNLKKRTRLMRHIQVDIYGKWLNNCQIGKVRGQYSKLDIMRQCNRVDQFTRLFDLLEHPSTGMPNRVPL